MPLERAQRRRCGVRGHRLDLEDAALLQLSGDCLKTRVDDTPTPRSPS